MSQNTSSAVIAQRHEPLDSLDFFPTPPWATRALIEHVLKPLDLYRPRSSVWEPACGEGHMVRPLHEYFDDVRGTDVWDYGCGFAQFDFLNLVSTLHRETGAWTETADWVITNPPFKIIDQFLIAALQACGQGVAFLCRMQVLEGIGRYHTIFEPFQGRFCFAPFVQRVPIVKGRVDPAANRPTAYGWLVISPGRQGLPPLKHIPPCRAELERQGDYQ